MDNTYIGEQIRVSTRHTNNLKKWRDNDHISHILFALSRDLPDGETQKLKNKRLFLKQTNHNLLLSLTHLPIARGYSPLNITIARK